MVSKNEDDAARIVYEAGLSQLGSRAVILVAGSPEANAAIEGTGAAWAEYASQLVDLRGR